MLYGSVARGEARRESDIDLLIVVKDAPSEYYVRLEPILKAEKLLNKNRLRSLGAKKVKLGDGTWYWDLKPDLKLGEVFEL